MPWLVYEEQVLASVAVAQARAERRRRPLGYKANDGTVLPRPTLSTRTVGMRPAVFVAHLDRDLQVLRTTSMTRSRVGMPVLAADRAVEAPAGSVGPPRLLKGGELEVWL